MSQEHPSLDLARRIWTAIAEGDAETLRGYLRPQVVWRAFGGGAPAEHSGREPVIEHLARLGESADELRSTLRTVFYNDEGAVLFLGVEARRGTRHLNMDALLLFRFQDGQLAAAFYVPMDQHENDRFWT